MAGGLVALLDDIATLARAAAASVDDVAVAAGHAGAKAVGVVVDDTAVTPTYLNGIRPERELPIIKRITLGSLRNKILVILPIALLLSQFAPFLLPPILLVGGFYLSFEGMEKVWEKILGHRKDEAALAAGPDAEDQVVRATVRTDLILSSEIMIIALAEVAEYGLLARTVSLIIVAFGITFLVYGLVALLVKMDDIGAHLSREQGRALGALGRGIVAAMPIVLRLIGVIGTLAMIWVGGHLLLSSSAELGLAAPAAAVTHIEEAAHHAGGAVLAWTAETACSAAIGAVFGSLMLGLVAGVTRLRRHARHPHSGTSGADADAS